jgi:type I restriction enzyme S subunit
VTGFPQIAARRVLHRQHRPLRDDDEIVTAFRDGQVTCRSRRRLDGFTNADKEIGYHGVEPGDLVIHAMDGFAGAIGVSDSRGKMSPVAHTWRAVDGDERFAAYGLRALAWSGKITSLAKGIRERSTSFDASTLRELDLPWPELDVQRRIAGFLDEQVARLDAAARQAGAAASVAEEGIRRRRRLMLTNSDRFPPEPSARAVPARYVCKVTTGSGDTQDAEDDGAVPFYVRSDTPLTARSATFNTEAVLTSGDGAGVGKVFHHVQGRFHAHQRVYVLHSFRGVLPRYFFHYFSTFFADVALDGSAKSTVDSVRRDMITTMPVVLPAIDQQQVIVEELDRLWERSRQVVVTAARLTALLEERKRALITACVTGEFDASTASDLAAEAALAGLPVSP